MKHVLNTQCVALIFLVVISSVHAAELLTLQYESAPTAQGPWQPVDPARLQVQPNGVATLDASEARLFFRVRISGSNDAGALPLLRLADVPPATVEAARRHVRQTVENSRENSVSRPDLDDAQEWAGAELAPFASPIFSPGNGRVAPRLVEFKLLRPRAAARSGESFLHDLSSDNAEPRDKGYVIVSLDRSDLPVLQFATEGPTPGERLLRRIRSLPPARIVRYGPTFWAAEDAAGRLIANLGTEPFKIPHDYVQHMNTRLTGEIDPDAGRVELPPDWGLRLAAYASYEELKDDLENSPVHRLFRERRAQHARLLWDFDDGILPPVLELEVGETEIFLAGTEVSDVVVHWEESETPLANVTLPRTGGGFQAAGLQEGSAPVTYRTSAGVGRAALRVRGRGVFAAAGASPLTVDVDTWIAGNGWSDQMHYFQLEDDDWCDLVGCGPVAVAMLFGWWDRRGVPGAFWVPGDGNSLNTTDAPQEMTSASAKAKIRKVYNELHDLCDVACFPFTDAGATWPGDLIEGFKGYAFVPYLAGKLKAPTSYAWDAWGDDWETSGSRVADGLIKGRPGVIGLGVLWHYGVAYAYRRETYYINNTVFMKKRFFKVNEGWSDFSPSYYSAYDVFLGLTAKMSNP